MADVIHRFGRRGVIYKRHRRPARLFRGGLIAGAGLFTLTGEAVTFKISEVVARGSFTLTGEAITTLQKIVAAEGSFALTGEAVTFQTKPTVATGLYVLIGEAVNALIEFLAATGSFVLTGHAAGGNVFQTGASTSKDPNMMIVLGFGPGTKLLMDFDENEFYYLSPSALTQITPALAAHLYNLQATKIFNPFFGVGWIKGPPTLGTK